MKNFISILIAATVISSTNPLPVYIERAPLAYRVKIPKSLRNKLAVEAAGIVKAPEVSPELAAYMIKLAEERRAREALDEE